MIEKIATTKADIVWLADDSEQLQQSEYDLKDIIEEAKTIDLSKYKKKCSLNNTNNEQWLYDTTSELNNVSHIVNNKAYTHHQLTEDLKITSKSNTTIDIDKLKCSNSGWIIPVLANNTDNKVPNLVLLSDNYNIKKLIQTDKINLNFPNTVVLYEDVLSNFVTAEKSTVNTSGTIDINKAVARKNYSVTLKALESKYLRNLSYHNSSIKKIAANLPKVIEAPGAFRADSESKGTINTFSGVLKSLVDGYKMFENQPLQTFISPVSNLIQGVDMFKNTNLSNISIELIVDSLPTVRSSNIYRVNFIYPTLEYSDGQYNIINKNRNWSSTHAGELTISWKDPKALSIQDKEYILVELFPLAVKKGWTIDTNISLEESNKVYVKKQESDNIFATHTDSSGKVYTIHTATTVLGDKKDKWQLFDSTQQAIEQWGLTEYKNLLS